MGIKIKKIILAALTLCLLLALGACGEGRLTSSKDVIEEGRDTETENSAKPAPPGNKQEQSGQADSGEPYRLSFHTDFPYADYNGKQVYVRGYMSTLSPLDGSYMYVMNLPYQDCPYCEPNTTNITVTVTAYAPAGKSFEFYDGAIEVTGTLETGSFKDDIGYQYDFRIADASYEKLDMSALSDNMRIYGRLSKEGLIAEIVRLTNATDFNAFFEEYGGEASEISLVQSKEYDELIAKINAVDAELYVGLVGTLEKFKEFNNAVNANVAARNYEANMTNEMHMQAFYCFTELSEWMVSFEL